jgi:ATP-dependent Clp protease ATP-binding subunit ClpA
MMSVSLNEQLEAAKLLNGKKNLKTTRSAVTEENVAEVVAMMCGIPVTKVVSI